jgi:hypothetical protein
MKAMKGEAGQGRPAVEAQAEAGAFVPQGLWCWAAYAASVIVPASGLALGLFFAAHKEKGARRFGLTCLALAALGWGLGSLAGWLEDLGFGKDRYLENYW